MLPHNDIKLIAVGDIAFNGPYEDMVREGKTQEVFTKVTPVLTGADFAFGNLEGALTSRPPVAPPWRYCLRGHPEYATVLRSAGFRLLSLANNHIMDCGWDAVEETQRRLQAVDILSVGVGRNLEAARQPAYVSIRGRRYAFLAYCSVPVGVHLYATASQPGVAPAGPYMIEDIRAAKRTSDTVVVCMHWGQEHVHYPIPSQRRLAREMIAAGATLIVGHHPHVLQGVEAVDRGLVAYSLGNLTFAEEEWNGSDPKGAPFRMQYRLSEPARRTAVLRLAVDGTTGSVRHEVIPAYLGADLRVTPDPQPDRAKDFKRYSARLRKPGYSVLWAGAMVWSRGRVLAKGIFPEKGLFWKRLRRWRPRHLRDLMRLILREWEQIRGQE